MKAMSLLLFLAASLAACSHQQAAPNAEDSRGTSSGLRVSPVPPPEIDGNDAGAPSEPTPLQPQWPPPPSE